MTEFNHPRVESVLEMEVSDFVENEGWIATSTKGPKTRGEWRFAAVNGGTRFTYVLDYQMPMPIVGGILDTLLIKGNWVRFINKSVQNLKRALET